MTIKQRTRSLPIATATGERTIVVRRLPWKAAKHFYAELAKLLAALFAPGPAADPAAPPAPAFSFFPQLPSLVAASDELVVLLLTGATDLSADELETLDWGDILALVDAALAVNLDDEIKNCSAGVIEKVRAFVAPPTKTNSGVASTPS